MTDHTPTPWQIDDDLIMTVVDDIPDDIICEKTKERPIRADNWDANAAFIVKAVNNHDALVDTLKFLLDVLEISCVQQGTDITNPTPESAIGRARAVLASAD